MAAPSGPGEVGGSAAADCRVGKAGVAWDKSNNLRTPPIATPDFNRLPSRARVPADRPDPKPRGRFSANDLGCHLNHFHPRAKERYRPRAGIDRSDFCTAGISVLARLAGTASTSRFGPARGVLRRALCLSRTARGYAARRDLPAMLAARCGHARSGNCGNTADGNAAEWRTCKYAGTAGQLCDGGRSPGHDRAARPGGATPCGAACRASAQHRLGDCGRGNTAIRQDGKSPERQHRGTAATIPWMAEPRS